MIRSSVVLPDPLSPEDREEFALGDLQRDIPQHGVLAEMFGNGANAEQRGRRIVSFAHGRAGRG